MDKSTFEERKVVINGSMHGSLKHDSAHKHVTGAADYIDDIPEPAGLLHGALGLSDRAHAEIVAIDLSDVKAYPDVVWVFTGKDFPASTTPVPMACMTNHCLLKSRSNSTASRSSPLLPKRAMQPVALLALPRSTIASCRIGAISTVRSPTARRSFTSR